MSNAVFDQVTARPSNTSQAGGSYQRSGLGLTRMLLQGKSSRQIPDCLGYNGPEEVVHRANISLLVLSDPLSASQTSLDELPHVSAANAPGSNAQAATESIAHINAVHSATDPAKSPAAASFQHLEGSRAGLHNADPASSAGSSNPNAASSRPASYYTHQISPEELNSGQLQEHAAVNLPKVPRQGAANGSRAAGTAPSNAHLGSVGAQSSRLAVPSTPEERLALLK